MILPASNVLAFLAASGLDRFVRNLSDTTFAGIHQLGWFDWSLLIPYFGTLAILSIYGLHRYDTIRTYFKHRRNVLKEPRERFDQLPRVTIQLPIYNERYVIERLIDEVTKVEYPKELLQIQVLDDSTDETHPYAEALCERYQALGFPIEYHHRANREGFKAGALGEGLKTATGEFVAVFDADFIPPVDFLQKTIQYFADPNIGVVQTRWSYLNREYNFLTEVEAMLLDGHFSEYPDNMNVTYEYPDGRLLIYENYPFTPYGMHGFDNGNVFYGTEGYMIFSRRGAFSVFLGPKSTPGPTEGKEIRGERGYAEHMANFLDGVRKRTPTRAAPEIAHRSCALVHLGDIALQTRGRLDFDPKTERFVDCDEANQLLTKKYRAPYGLGANV